MATVISGARRAASAATTGRATARVGGSSSRRPRTERDQAGDDDSTVPSATSALSVTAPCGGRQTRTAAAESGA